MNLKSYVLSVAAIVIITQISELLLPQGRMKNATRMVFALVTTLIFVSPVLNFAKEGFSIDEFVYGNEVEIDVGFIVYSDSVREKLIEDDIVGELAERGYIGVGVSASVESSSGQIIIKNILINFENLVIFSNEQHINKTEVIEIVAAKLNIDEGRISIIGD